MISFDDLLRYADNKFKVDTQKSLSKMQNFLIQKGVASSFREVKELPRTLLFIPDRKNQLCI